VPVCGYVVIPEDGSGRTLARKLAGFPGCDVARAENRELLLLVTDTPGAEEDRALRRRLEAMDGIRALVLAFGEIDPETSQGDPLQKEGRPRGRRLPVLDPGELQATAPFPSAPSGSGDP
jgi:nitrate reductase NapAB chaperone NapD